LGLEILRLDTDVGHLERAMHGVGQQRHRIRVGEIG
jgi:hypothetical protein